MLEIEWFLRQNPASKVSIELVLDRDGKELFRLRLAPPLGLTAGCESSTLDGALRHLNDIIQKAHI